MNTKQGAQRLIIVPNTRTEWFSLVSHTMCSVIESVSMDLCRCWNSRRTAVLSRFPQRSVFGLTDTDTWAEGVIINIVCGLVSPMNSTGHADSRAHTDRPAVARTAAQEKEKSSGGVGKPQGLFQTWEKHGQVLLFRGCLAWVFPLFLQLWSLVESLLCSSKSEMWGESTLSEIGTQMSAERREEKNTHMTVNNSALALSRNLGEIFFADGKVG